MFLGVSYGLYKIVDNLRDYSAEIFTEKGQVNTVSSLTYYHIWCFHDGFDDIFMLFRDYIVPHQSVIE